MNREADVEVLAARIKRLRLASGLTRGQLGDSVGVSATSVGKWETGPFLPRGRNVAKLAGALGIDVTALLGETPISLDDLAEEVRLVAAYRALPMERKSIAITLVEALK